MRLIDADKLKKDLKSATLSNGTLLNTNTVLALLDKYPTAYDVDKVLRELEKAKPICLDWSDEARYYDFKRIVNIVKAGGNS